MLCLDFGGGKLINSPSMTSRCIPSSGSCSNASQVSRLVVVAISVLKVTHLKATIHRSPDLYTSAPRAWSFSGPFSHPSCTAVFHLLPYRFTLGGAGRGVYVLRRLDQST